MYWIFIFIALFYVLVEFFWGIFTHSFKVVDDYVQNQHMNNLYRMKVDDLHKMFCESEEMAA